MTPSDDLEVRDYSTVVEVRDMQAVGAGRAYKYLEGRAAPYDTWADCGWFLEQHAAGSFKRSTNGRTGKGLPLMLFHDAERFPIGHAERWEHRDDGMHGVWRLNETADAQTAAHLAETGDLLGLSVGFQDATAPRWDYPPAFDPLAALVGDIGPDEKARVTRLESRLVEVSMTPTPAYADAGVLLVRTRARPPEPKERAVDAWRRTYDQLSSGQ